MLRGGQAASGEEVAAGRGRPVACRRVAGCLRLEKRGRGLVGCHKWRKSGKTNADLTHHILRARDTGPAREI